MNPSEPLKLLGLTNSLRPGSYNRMAMEAVGGLMPDAIRVLPFDLTDIAFFEPEDDPAHCPPSAALAALALALSTADGVLIAVPEYNHSIPGRLKNALDMVSRLPSQPMAGMPVMVISASTGRLGGARAQYELRRVLDAIGAVTLIRPEVFIGDAKAKFDAAGECTDPTTLDFLLAQLDAFRRLLSGERVRRKAVAWKP